MLIDEQVYKLPTDRFYATYFGGDEQLGLAPDDEARDIWLKFLPPGHVLPFGCKVCIYSILFFFPLKFHAAWHPITLGDICIVIIRITMSAFSYKEKCIVNIRKNYF